MSELRNVCPYTAVFHPFVPEGSEKISKNRDLVRPFVIKPPLETKETYLPGERLSFDVVLVGKAKDYLPYFIVTFKELSQAGLGRERSPVELCAVGHVGSDGDEVPVYTREKSSRQLRLSRGRIFVPLIPRAMARAMLGKSHCDF